MVLGLVVLMGVLTACDAAPVVVRGVVTTPTGATVGGVEVVAYDNSAGEAVASTVTNGLGQWALRSSALGEGTYRLRIGGRWWSDAASWATATPVVLDSTNPPEVSSQVDPSTRVTGSLVDANVSAVTGWTVVATSADGGVVATAGVDASGAFRLPLASGAGTYRLSMVGASGTVVSGGATPIDYHVGAGQDLRVGPIDPTTGATLDPGTVASSPTGPYAVATTAVAAGNGFGGGTIYAPTSSVHAPFGAVVVTPGFLMDQSQMAWYGPRLASQGFVVFTINTNNPTDAPAARATQMLAALDWLTGSSPVAGIVDPSRTSVMGWSMGGGGALNAAVQRPSLKTVIALAPWEPARYPTLGVPALVVACQNDTIAPVASNASPIYDSFPASLTREYIEMAGQEHFCVTNSVSDPGVRTAIARQSLGFLQRYVNGDERYLAAVICPTPTIGGVLSDARSSCAS